jgi:hypothetical protein
VPWGWELSILLSILESTISESLGGLEQGFGRCWSGGDLAVVFLIWGIPSFHCSSHPRVLEHLIILVYAIQKQN